MSFIEHPAQSFAAASVAQLVDALQLKLLTTLGNCGTGVKHSKQQWQRDGGRHGGGQRYVLDAPELFNRASINISQVHYDDEPHKQLGSATALSTIIHPQNPQAPSLHMHISWTEMKAGQGYWRIMADLNPSLASDEAEAFEGVFKFIAPELCAEGFRQGEEYFYIPVLKRHRGLRHFYLESHHSGDFARDMALAKNCGEGVIAYYGHLLAKIFSQPVIVNQTTKQIQLDYHTLYFFQVLTLDRGTTSGLLVHNQNDTGILASLPSHVNRDLLESWVALMPEPQGELLQNILRGLPDASYCPVDESLKPILADALRSHYQKYPQALDLQARATVVPPTVANHRS